MSQFKVGEWVRCVDDHGVTPWLVEGWLYQIERLATHAVHPCMVQVQRRWFQRSRFEALPELKVGDVVRCRPREECETRDLEPVFTSVMSRECEGADLVIQKVQRVDGEVLYGAGPDWCYYWRREWLELVATEAAVIGADDQQHHADAGKPRLSLIPSRGLMGCMPALEDGAKKYGERTYLQVQDALSRYLESLLRHAEALRQAYQDQGAEGVGVLDPKSGVSHLSHLTTDGLILLDLLAREPHDGEETEEA